MPILEERPMTQRLSVDYPQQGERITSSYYTMRISAPEGVTGVEIAIDQGAWLPCRQAAGYWWFDWSNFRTGEHEVVARIQTNGKRVSSEPHEFFVELPSLIGQPGR